METEGDPKTAKEKKSAFSIKEWVGFTTSLIAFALSVFTFYMAHVRKVDDVRISLDGPMSAVRIGDSFMFTSRANGTFINNGTRSVGIQSAGLLVSQNPSLTGDRGVDCYNNAELYQLEIEPIVVKPQELVIRSLHKFEPFAGHALAHTFADDDSLIQKFSDANAASNPILVCLVLAFIVPEHPQRAELVVLFAENWLSTSPSAPAGKLYLDQPPFILLKESSFSPIPN
jgi:hypothetical protein